MGVGGNHSANHMPPTQARTLGGHPNPQHPVHQGPLRGPSQPKPGACSREDDGASPLSDGDQDPSPPQAPLTPLTSSTESPYRNALTLTRTSTWQAGPCSPGSLLRPDLLWGMWHSEDAVPAVLHPSPGCGRATLQTAHLVFTGPEAHIPLLSVVPGTWKTLPCFLNELPTQHSPLQRWWPVG